MTAGASPVAAVLVVRSALAAAPLAEVKTLAQQLATAPGIDAAAFAFTDYGSPSLRETVLRLRAEGFAELLLLPLLYPMEPSIKNWLGRALARWRVAHPGAWPVMRVAPPPAASPALHDLLRERLAAAKAAPPQALVAKTVSEGAVIPQQKRRALMCQDYPCNNAGAASLWERLRRAETGDVACARTSCLGPCSLAPVMQVFPEGTYYCGVDEAALERIIATHLIGGTVAADLAYFPTGKKQRLRDR